MIQIMTLASAFAVGVIFAIIGAIKLEFTKVLKVDDLKVGGLISTLMFTCMIMVLIAGILVDAIGYKPVAVVGSFIACISVFLLISARTYTVAFVACILMGVGAMCLSVVSVKLMSIVLLGGTNPPAAVNLGNVFYGLGAFLTPLLIGLLLRKLGYTTTGNIIASFLLIPIVFAALASYPVVASDFRITEAFGLLTSGIIVVSALALFFYVGLEISMGGWISTYARDIGFSERGANMVLSTFWICLMVGRLVAAGFGIRPVITPEIGTTSVLVLAIASVVSIGIMMIARTKLVAGAGVILTGLIFGPVFPTIVGVTFSKTDEALHGSAYGIIFAIGLLGASIIPAVIGILSKAKTIQKSFSIAMGAAVMLCVMAVLMGRV